LPIDSRQPAIDNQFMQMDYKSRTLERTLKVVKGVTSAMVVASFVLLFGFRRPLLPRHVLFNIQLVLLFVFLAGKVLRLLNAESARQYIYANWFEIPMLIALAFAVTGARRWFPQFSPVTVRHFSVGIYLIIEVVIKICIASVGMAASGKNPTRTLIASFVVLIISGTGLLMLPRSSAGESIGFVDSLFTATSATCVTGLIVKDTGTDFSLMGQIIILTLIQLGGLGIIVFGAVLALLLGANARANRQHHRIYLRRYYAARGRRRRWSVPYVEQGAWPGLNPSTTVVLQHISLHQRLLQRGLQSF